MSVPKAIEEALESIRATFARKNADYATDDEWSSNFRMAAEVQGIRPVDVADTLIAVKQARLAALRANGRTPANEAVVDTYLDRAVYAIIAMALLPKENDESS